jgi:hypothetical protein
MTLPTGQISFSDIQTEFGGSNPISLDEYYKNGTYIKNTDYAPSLNTSGSISLSQLQGSKKTVYNLAAFVTSQNWTVPLENNGSVDVYMEGGGGGGGMRSNYWGGYGGDGGNGGIASKTLTVTPNTEYYVEVGAGGGAGHYGYGYKDNPFADGYPGGGGGQSSFNSLKAGGGGGGAGGTSGQNGPSGGGTYGGAGGQQGAPDGYGNDPTHGGDGTGSANTLSWGGATTYGDRGIGGHYTSDNSGGNYYALSGPAYSNGQPGVVYIYGYW